MSKLEKFKDKSGLVRYRLVAANGRILMSSEAYRPSNSKRDYLRIKSACKQAGCDRSGYCVAMTAAREV